MLDAKVLIESIGTDGGRAITLTADGEARLELATRFGWLEVSHLEAVLELRQVKGAADSFDVTGHITARLVQACRSTGNPVPEELDIEVHERFVTGAGADETGATGATEIDPAEVSVEIIEGDAIPVGEMVAQLAGLGASPWPRDAAADLPESAEFGANRPFASLAEWKKKN